MVVFLRFRENDIDLSPRMSCAYSSVKSELEDFELITRSDQMLL